MTEQTRRTVTLRRTGPGRFEATNPRGGRITFGESEDAFTPVELLLAAVGGCTGLDVDALTSRRAEPETFRVEVTAEKVRDADGNHLEDVRVTFHVTFPEGAGGDEARRILPQMVAMSHDRLCTVSRTLERPTPVTSSVA